MPARILSKAGSVGYNQLASGNRGAGLNAVREPGDIAFTPDGEHAYLGCRLDDDAAAVRTSDLEVTARIGGCSHPTGIAILADGSYAYICNCLGDLVLVVRTSDNTVVEKLRFNTITDFSVVDPNAQ